MNFLEADPRPPLETRQRSGNGKLEAKCPTCGQWRLGFLIVLNGAVWECDGDISKREREA